MVESSAQLVDLVHQHNRHILGELLITLGVGVISCIIIFGGIYWLSFLAFTMCFRGLAYGGPWMMAGIITIVFFLASLLAAWRQVDPIAAANITVDDSPGRVLEDMVGLSLGIPIIRRDSIAGAGALLIGGPASLLEVWPMWCGRISANADLIAEGQRLLASSVQGVDPKAVRNPMAVALLYRLSLIKAVHQPDGSLRLLSTQKGTEIAATAMRTG